MGIEKDNIKVDAEVRAELSEFKAEINKTIQESVSAGFEQVEKHVTDLFNKDIDHIKETQDRHAKHHEEHFGNDKELRKEFSNFKDYIHSEISGVKTAIIKEKTLIETKERIEDKAEDKADKKKNTNYAFWGLIIALATVFGSIAGYLIK